MKKLMFLVHFGNIVKSSGIIEKIITQSTVMHEEGLLYKTFILYNKDQVNDIKKYNVYDYISFVPYENQNGTNKIQKFKNANDIYKKYEEICENEKNNYDLIYMRFNPIFPGFIRLTKKYKGKFVFEHNSIELTEFKANKSVYNVVMSYIFDKSIRKNAFGFVAVTDQIYKYQKSLYGQINGICIPNGIDVYKYDVRRTPKYDGKNINLLFVGNIRYWHGLDRIMNAIAKYKKNGKRNIHLTICGPINEKDSLTPLIKELNLEKSVEFAGPKSQEELNSYFDKSHLAIGALGCYRKNIEYACTLKNREYLSRGIPIVFSEIDEDLPKKYNKKIYYKVANSDDEINMAKIVLFIDHIYKNDAKKLTKEIRTFAENNIDYHIKIRKLKEFLNEEK